MNLFDLGISSRSYYQNIFITYILRIVLIKWYWIIVLDDKILVWHLIYEVKALHLSFRKIAIWMW